MLCRRQGDEGILVAVAGEYPIVDASGTQRTPGHLIGFTLDRVACGTCGISYETPDRGRYIKELEAELAERRAKDKRLQDETKGSGGSPAYPSPAPRAVATA